MLTQNITMTDSFLYLLVLKPINRLTRTRIHKYLPSKLKEWASKKTIIYNWKQQENPVPPPHIFKQYIIRNLQRRTGISTFVETGTYKGHMIEAMVKSFDTLYSIELDQTLHLAAKERFNNLKNIHLILGDSAIQLKFIVEELNQPAIFWLDGHYSEGDTAKGKDETPIIDELESIFASPYEHVIVIDDARCFNGKKGYPKLEELRKIIYEKHPEWIFQHLADQIIVCHDKYLR